MRVLGAGMGFPSAFGGGLERGASTCGHFRNQGNRKGLLRFVQGMLGGECAGDDSGVGIGWVEWVLGTSVGGGVEPHTALASRPM